MVKIVDIFKNDSAIIFLSNKYISSKIIDKINVIGKDCGWQYINKSNSIFVFYYYLSENINKTNTDTVLEEMYKHPENIRSYLRLDIYDTYAEIYDVCTLLLYRKLSYMTYIFKSIFKNYNNKIWLGVKITDSHRDLLLSFYTNLGFQIEKYRNKTYSGHLLDFVFIGLLYTPNNFVKQNIQNINKIQNVKNINNINWNILNELKYTINIKIKESLLKKLYNSYSLGKYIEYGGSFNVIDNMLIEGEVVKGNNYTVSVPDAAFSWHTHPASCYTTMGCYIAWPSGKDMSNIFIKYLTGLLLHLIITEEGVYIINLSKNMMEFIHIICWNQSWITDITNLISERFTYLENYRNVKYCLQNFNSLNCLFSNTQHKQNTISNFINVSNNVPLHDFIQYNKNTDQYNKQSHKNTDQYKSLEDCINYYTLQTGNKIDFPIFSIKYISSYINIKDREIKLDILPSPDKIIFW